MIAISTTFSMKCNNNNNYIDDFIKLYFLQIFSLWCWEIFLVWYDCVGGYIIPLVLSTRNQNIIAFHAENFYNVPGSTPKTAIASLFIYNSITDLSAVDIFTLFGFIFIYFSFFIEFYFIFFNAV